MRPSRHYLIYSPDDGNYAVIQTTEPWTVGQRLPDGRWFVVTHSAAPFSAAVDWSGQDGGAVDPPPTLDSVWYDALG